MAVKSKAGAAKRAPRAARGAQKENPRQKREIRGQTDDRAKLIDRIQQLGAQVRTSQKQIQASYDAAGYSDEFKNYWANADNFDADSANSPLVRHTLIQRKRYELANNGYADGIAQTYATDLVGPGPSLRMQTGSDPFNQMVETRWGEFCEAINFHAKLWCMAHAKHSDGEAFGIVHANPRLDNPVKIDIRLYEAEQIQTPMLPWGEPNYVDGIKLDDYGNPLWYDLLPQHPGHNGSTAYLSFTPIPIAASLVMHWFKMRRPGQHRGVVEGASTLQLGAAFRRLREAALSTAEKIAAWTLFLKSIAEPDEDDAEWRVPMSTLEIVHGMLTNLPNGSEPVQLKAEQPGPEYNTFHRSLLSEQARPHGMSYNKAAADSKDSNYASGRLDFMPYYDMLDIDRISCNRLVLNKLFPLWFDRAIITYGWLGGDPTAVGAGARAHLWDWPKHRVADVEAEARANDIQLRSAQKFPHQVFTESGSDIEDELAKASITFGQPVETIRQRMFDNLYPPAPPKEKPLANAPALNGSRFTNGHLNGHGVG